MQWTVFNVRSGKHRAYVYRAAIARTWYLASHCSDLSASVGGFVRAPRFQSFPHPQPIPTTTTTKLQANIYTDCFNKV